MTLRTVFARNLKDARTRAAMSQEALAAAAGLDRTYISLLERERYSVSVDTLEAIAGVLGLAPHLLITPAAEAPED
jgi:transcriptional regulator with XRE-family HTH domain